MEFRDLLQTAVLILFFISAAVLIFLILIQSGKGGGMGMLGGGGSGSAFGSSTVDVVEKATWYGSVIFFVLAVLAAIAFANTGPSLPMNPDASDSGIPSETAPQATPSQETAPGNPSGNAK